MLVYGLAHTIEKDKLRRSLETGKIEKYLQKVPVKKDDVFFIEAGTIHAIGEGALISEIQEEVHRFSVAYHHKKHTRRGLELSLTKIDGIGEAKAKALLKHFKTVKAIRCATVDELSEVSGINKNLAEKIYDFYNKGE